jgi:SAM-dependent methyltransferase
MFGKRRDIDAGSKQRPFAAHLRPYVEAVETLGATFEATLWASREHQRTRFGVLREMCDFGGMVVLDAGCARADLAVFLVEHGAPPATYVGVEGVPDLVRAARDLAPPGSVIVEADFVADGEALTRALAQAGQADGRADVIVFSGSLNTLRTDGALRVLERAWPLCRRALAFNFLSDRCAASVRGGTTGPAHRFDTERMLAWALARTPAVRFRQDYFPGGHDATVVMRREPG